MKQQCSNEMSNLLIEQTLMREAVVFNGDPDDCQAQEDELDELIDMEGIKFLLGMDVYLG